MSRSALQREDTAVNSITGHLVIMGRRPPHHKLRVRTRAQQQIGDRAISLFLRDRQSTIAVAVDVVQRDVLLRQQQPYKIHVLTPDGVMQRSPIPRWIL